ncbi:MAG: hypothetical protein HY870_01060 [Chloroflexi bacterium]|nr:hypothetical protein [Chloroflexota bacterium]
MKNLLILILLAVVAYLLYTSGTLSRAVKIAQTAVPGLATLTSDGATPEISVTVYSPYGTGRTPEPVQVTVIAPQPVATAYPIVIEPTAFIITPPPPTIIIPAIPPTLAVATTPTPSALFVITVDSPREGETVRATPLTVRGQTTPGAVVSANDAVAIADAQGRFALTVPLDPGPNVLEIIASKTSGEQIFAILTVLYQP